MGAVDFDTVQRAIYNWSSTALGLPVTWGFQKRPQDSRSTGFGVLTLLSVGMPPDQERDETIYEKAAGQVYLRLAGTRRIVVNLQCLTLSQLPASSAMTLLSNAQASLRSTPGLDTAGITVISDSAITNLSGVIAEGYECRASMDLTFDVVSDFTATAATDWFNNAVINGKQIGPP